MALLPAMAFAQASITGTAKDATGAIRAARHSLFEKKTARAASILTRAYCLQHDLGAAKAELAHVTGPERARVLRACRAAGMDL